MQTQQFIGLILGAAVVVTGGGVLARDGQTPAPTFQEIDSNADGEITRAELDALRTARMARMDTDGDGFLTPEELTAASQQRSERRAERMLARLDANEDGKLSTEELAQMRGRRGGFERMDTDGNGALSQAEFDEARARMQARRGDRLNGSSADN